MAKRADPSGQKRERLGTSGIGRRRQARKGVGLPKVTRKGIGPPKSITELSWLMADVRDPSQLQQLDVAVKLHDYVRQPEVFTLAGFASEIRVSPAVLTYWRGKFPVIQLAYESAKDYLAGKRFNMAAAGDARESLMKWSAQYDTEAYTFLKQMEELKVKVQEEQKPTQIVINMKDFSNKEE